MSVNHSARSGGIIVFFSIFFNMKVCCVFSLESPHKGDSNEYIQHPIIKTTTKRAKTKKTEVISCNIFITRGQHFGFLFVCFWLSGPSRQYFSLYRAAPQREGEDERMDSGE